MSWFSAPGYWLSRLVFERALALTYLLAFVAARNQFRPLLGTRGLLPIPRFVAVVPFGRAPSIFQWRYSDRLFAVVAWTGVAGSVAVLAGVVDASPWWCSVLVWLLLWALYLSIVNVGQLWYGFGWESLLLEAGFIAAFLGPARTAPPVLVLWLLRWLLFRLEFGAGLIKLRGDPCWRDLTCLYYHHETQPMPNPLSWRFHHLAKPLHRIEVAANHFAQLVVPWGLFLPQPVAGVAALIIVVTQAWLVTSGNFAWLNFLTIALAVSVLGDGLLHHVVHVSPPVLHEPSAPFAVLVVCLTVVVVVLSRQPAANLVSRRQAMNRSFNAWHLVNTYGAFGSVTRDRHEIVVEGTDATTLDGATEWREYEFKGKPGDVHRRPPQFAPYHLRLDWLMWFAALSPSYAEGWFVPFLRKLLAGDDATLKLLRHNPFPDEPPTYVRARFYRYRFTTRDERKATGAFWHRTYAGEFVRPMRRDLVRDTTVPQDRT